MVLSIALIAGIAFLLGTSARRAPAEPARRRVALGSPAQVWLERGERVRSEIRASVASQPGWAIIGADAENVVVDLTATADRVAEINAALGPVDLGQLTVQRDQLADEVVRAGPDAVADTRAALETVRQRLASAQHRLAERDALLAKMRAAVVGLEHCRHEVDNLLDEASPAQLESTAPILALTTRLAGLRAGLTEVRSITEAGADPDRTVPFAAPRPTPGAPPGPPVPPPPGPAGPPGSAGPSGRPGDTLRDNRWSPGAP